MAGLFIETVKECLSVLLLFTPSLEDTWSAFSLLGVLSALRRGLLKDQFAPSHLGNSGTAKYSPFTQRTCGVNTFRPLRDRTAAPEKAEPLDVQAVLGSLAMAEDGTTLSDSDVVSLWPPPASSQLWQKAITFILVLHNLQTISVQISFIQVLHICRHVICNSILICNWWVPPVNV